MWAGEGMFKVKMLNSRRSCRAFNVLIALGAVFKLSFSPLPASGSPRAEVESV